MHFEVESAYNIPTSYEVDAGAYDDSLENEVVQEDALPDLSDGQATTVTQGQEITETESVIALNHEVLTPAELQVATVEETAVVLEQTLVVPESSVTVQPSVQLSDTVIEYAEPSPYEQTLAPEPEVQEATAISITRTDTSERVDPQLTQAYASYRTNDFIGARARYHQVLREKPNNRDAILGLAAVAMRLGDTTNARESYIQLLELDPRDVHARVGLLETMPSTDPVMLESELRALFAAHPEVAQLAFALGNHFASQGRWSDAQQSYYDALLAAKAGGNGAISPDYSFNLAVSLERLNQLSSAYTFYREALEQSEFVNPSFDIPVLRERLDALERALP